MAGAGEAFVGIDVAKLRNAVAIADAGRDGEVRFYGEVDASPDSMRRPELRWAGIMRNLVRARTAAVKDVGLKKR